MPSLTDRFYEKTIPEYGPGPALTVLPREEWTYRDIDDPPDRVATVTTTIDIGPLREAVDRLAAAFRAFDRSHRRVELANEIGRKCAGNRRRQMRRT